MTGHHEGDELALIPDEPRRKGFSEEPQRFRRLRISDILNFSMVKSGSVLTLRRNGQLTLPADVRRQARANEGDVFVAEVRDRDEIVLRRKTLVDASQAYFWTEEWQRGEREAREDIRRHRVKRFRSAKALIADLKR